jgi:hypothetical protein
MVALFYGCMLLASFITIVGLFSFLADSRSATSKRKTSTAVSAVFWLHFAVAVASHICVVLIVCGSVALVFETQGLSFWIKGLLFGITFYSAMYAINHVTNKDGFCVLTDLENYYREKAGMPLVKEFTPRFYKRCRAISSAVKKTLGLPVSKK